VNFLKSILLKLCNYLTLNLFAPYNQSDTYHDTQIHYLMDQDPLLLKDQVDGIDFTTADRMEALKENHGPSRARLKSILRSVLHV
jgi:hypothetical protein